MTEPVKRLFSEATGTPLSLDQAPAGAPNVVVVLLDDVGFGSFSTFGGPITTPACDRVAAQGLRYNQFHTTALCAPTRASLLTGRNHHTVHMGCITEVANSFPGYDSIIPAEAATVAEVLRSNGYTQWIYHRHVWQRPSHPPVGGRPGWPL